MGEWRDEIRSRLDGLALDPAREAEIVEEFEQHLDDRHAELLAEGLGNETAREQALSELETDDLLRASMRRLRQSQTLPPGVPGAPSRGIFADIVQDVRYGFRLLRLQPAFSAIAVLVLALGIGVNVSTFTVLNILLLKPRPGGVDAHLTGVFSRSLTEPDDYREFSWDEFARLRDRTDLFPSVTGHGFGMLGLQEGDATRRVFADIVTAGFFETFGVAPILGRGFTRDEERPGANLAVTVISYGLWQRLGGSRDVIGQTLSLNTRAYTIVGVAPQGFGGSMAMVSPEVFVPTGMYDSVVFDARNEGAVVRLGNPNTHALIVVARLPVEATAADTAPALPAVSRQVFDASPGDHRDYEVTLAPLSRMSVSTRPQVDDELTDFMSIVLVLSGVVLLIAAFNLANMLLARGRARAGEFAIRAAIGGSRSRLVRQLLAEHLVLATVGAAGGLALSTVAMQFLVSQTPAVLPISLSFDPTPDVRVVASTVGFTLLAAIVFGLAPAWRFSRVAPASSLKELPSDVAGRGRWPGLTGRNALMTAQVALTFVMLTATGLFVGGAMEAARADPGFSLDRGIIANLDTTFLDHTPEQSRAFYQEATARLRALPGVESASLASYMPFAEFESAVNVFRPDEPDAGVSSTVISIEQDYFVTMGIALRAGRDFSAAEVLNDIGDPVVIIDEVLAGRLFGEAPAVGQFVRASGGDGSVAMRVIGVAAGFKGDLFDTAPRPAIYFPFGRHARANMYLHARTNAPSADAEAAMLPTVRAMLARLEANPPIVSLETRPIFRERNLLLAVVRAGAALFALLGGAALFLAAVGVYGVKSYLVARRTREIGVRVALGAAPRDVVWMVLRDGLALVAGGGAIGAGLSVLTGMAMRPILCQGRALDLPVVGLAGMTLVAAILLASWLPARRATRVPPTTALQSN
jgi:predicted permease